MSDIPLIFDIWCHSVKNPQYIDEMPSNRTPSNNSKNFLTIEQAFFIGAPIILSSFRGIFLNPFCSIFHKTGSQRTILSDSPAEPAMRVFF